jgi:hypothetical protein
MHLIYKTLCSREESSVHSALSCVLIIQKVEVRDEKLYIQFTFFTRVLYKYS